MFKNKDKNSVMRKGSFIIALNSTHYFKTKNNNIKERCIFVNYFSLSLK